MSKSLVILIVGCILALAITTPAICEDLVGTVANGNGQAVQGVKVIVHSSDGEITEAATTDASGQYIVSGLDPGQYLITLDPAGSGVQGQTVAGYLGEVGLTVNWSVESGTSPLASAQPGIRLTSASSVNAASAVKSASMSGGQNGQGGQGQCPPKKSQKRCDDNQGNNNCQGNQNQNCQGNQN
jgi:hypothetical protein